MPRYRKGQSGNPAGRPKGTPNKATGSLRESLNKLLEDKFAQVVKDFDKLPPKDRVSSYLKLLEFVLPKQRQNSNIDVSQLSAKEVEELREQLGVEIKLPTIVFSSQSRKEPEEMTDEELGQEIERLKNIRHAISDTPQGGCR